jgi:hypothetical protein
MMAARPVQRALRRRSMNDRSKIASAKTSSITLRIDFAKQHHARRFVAADDESFSPDSNRYFTSKGRGLPSNCL